mgnify:CR=1 FL=1
MIICVVGKSGSGKSYICELLKSYSDSILHLDIDIVAHDILKNPTYIGNLTQCRQKKINNAFLFCVF